VAWDHPGEAEMSEASEGQVELTTGLSQLASLLLSVESVGEALQHLARMAVVVVPDGPSCSITVKRHGRFTTIVHAGPAHPSLTDLQYESSEGPSLDAIRTGSPVVVQDLTAEQRWGEFPQRAAAGGVYGVCVFPLEASGEVIGALGLYAHKPDVFPEPVLQIAGQFVEPAAVLLAGVLHRVTQAELISRLRAALSARGIIDQAIGIIMAYHRCPPEQAFRLLRKISNDRNVKVRILAAELVKAAATEAPLPTWASSGPKTS
jgi:GAF domain-containing protein